MDFIFLDVLLLLATLFIKFFISFIYFFWIYRLYIRSYPTSIFICFMIIPSIWTTILKICSIYIISNTLLISNKTWLIISIIIGKLWKIIIACLMLMLMSFVIWYGWCWWVIVYEIWFCIWDLDVLDWICCGLILRIDFLCFFYWCIIFYKIAFSHTSWSSLSNITNIRH